MTVAKSIPRRKLVAILAADGCGFQTNLRDRNKKVSLEDRVQFRVGLNLGDVIVEDDNLYGDGVNITARLEATAEPGGICVSGKFCDEVRQRKRPRQLPDRAASQKTPSCLLQGPWEFCRSRISAHLAARLNPETWRNHMVQ